MKQKLAELMYKLFYGNRRAWGAWRGNSYRTERKEITIENYLQHLEGKTIGIYPLLEAQVTCRVAAVDIDLTDLELVKEVSTLIPQPNYIERSRSGHYHIWMFFQEPVIIESLAHACAVALKRLRSGSSEHCNLYPLHVKGLGLLIALPFQLGLVDKGLTAFVDAEPNLAAQYSFLASVCYAVPPGSFMDNPQLKSLWLGEGKTSGDVSRSGYDFSFAMALINCGYTQSTIKAILAKRPGLHQDSEEYVTQTVEAALARVHAPPKSDTQALAPVKDWTQIEAIPRDELLKRLSKRLVMCDEQVQQFDIFFATIIANLGTKGRPVWLLFVGPPGCGKTMPMMAVQYAPQIYMTSAFRPSALISGFGMRGGEDMSLMPKLDGKVLLVKDMSSLLSQNKEVVGEVLGLLRDAYDGACSKPFGTGVSRTYTSRFGFIGATTPDIDAHWALNVRLGERFLRYRCRTTPEQLYEKIDRSIASLVEEEEVDLEIEEACMGFLKYLTGEDKPQPSSRLQLSDARTIGRLAQLGAILRTVVSRNPYGHEVLVVPEWEEGTRYAKQLAKMALGLAYVRGKETNGLEEMEDLKTLVRDAMDARVEKICRVLYARQDQDASEIAERICLPVWTVRSCLDDLAVARVLVNQRNNFQLKWSFVPWLEGQIKEFGLWPKGNENK